MVIKNCFFYIVDNILRNTTLLESLSIKGSFALLLVLMFFYWTQIAFFKKQKHKKNLSSFGMYLVNGSLAFFLFLRWIEKSHFPLSNLYESLIFLAWSITSIHIFLEKNLVFQRILDSNKKMFVGAVTAPCALFITGFATFTLPPDMQKATTLVPALQSNWLMMHVTIMIVSYAALIIGSLFSLLFLMVFWFLKITEDSIRLSYVQETSGHSFLRNRKITQLSSLMQILDNLSYRTLGLGFPLLTIGILSGSVWANEAWGSYWSWDPKETWALITWLTYAVYFHTRIIKGSIGRKPAIIASLGFVVVWICYLGVNLMGEGLHSYGWFEGLRN